MGDQRRVHGRHYSLFVEVRYSIKPLSQLFEINSYHKDITKELAPKKSPKNKTKKKSSKKTSQKQKRYRKDTENPTKFSEI